MIIKNLKIKALSRNDTLYSIITGVTTGLLAWLILKHLEKPTTAWLIVIVPVLWIAGVQFGYFLGRWIKSFEQFGIFAAIGFTNFTVDAGVLNLLIATTGIAVGVWYTVFKSISVVIAVTHSYFWNRHWTFSSHAKPEGEFIKFIFVYLVSIAINVAAASLVVNVLAPVGSDPKIWANIGSIVGSAIGLIFSFVGFRTVVFKK